MGQRANYVVKQAESTTIYYNHWRANCIISDLYLGPKRFLDFVVSCIKADELLLEPWIEGFVFIDIKLRQLHFWAQDYPAETSVMEYYIKELEKKWEGWKIIFLRNRMYDAEFVLEIEYIDGQKLHELRSTSEDRIRNDMVGDWETAVVVVIDKGLFVRRTGDLDCENLISYGKGIIQLLLNKPNSALPYEREDVTYNCIIIDVQEKKLFINRSEFGLWEQSKHLWQGYTFIMGDFGYLGALKLAGIDTAGLEMTTEEVIERFKSITKPVEGFDPIKMAERLQGEHGDIEFNPNFFDTAKPRKTVMEKLVKSMRKLLRIIFEK